MSQNGFKQKFSQTPLYWAPKNDIENVFKLKLKFYGIISKNSEEGII